MTTAPPRSDQLVHPLARQVMDRVEELHALAIEHAPPAEPFGDASPETLARLGRVRAQDQAAEELAQLAWLLERSAVEQKARDQQRWSAGDAKPDEPCPTCGAGPRQAHGALPHQVADEQAEPGYRACGCNPDVGGCVRRTGHQGVCAAKEMLPDDTDARAAAAAANLSGIAAFACRTDDAVPHPAVA